MAIVNSRAAIEPKTGKAAIFVNETIHSLIRKLFANNEQGFAYDPNDLTTMFRDAAGTVPVTGAGQPVGLIKDKSGRGNHARQTNSTSRPLLQRNATTGAYYLAFDGTDDFLQTNNIDFTSTDKVSVFAGVNVPLGANTGCVIELGTNATVNNGSFGLFKGPSTIQWASKGTSGVLGAIYNSPVSPDVLTAKAFINGSVLTTRRNSLLVINDTRSQGTGNYGNYPLYIGRRGGTSLPFNGHLYSLIGIGRLTSDSETIALEKSIAKNTGVTLSV